MRTTTPDKLVKVGTVYGDIAYVEAAAPRDGSRMLRMYHADGKPECERWKGCFDWHQKMLHPGNVFVVGTPELPDGWQAAAEKEHERIIAEVCAKTFGATP